MSDMFPDDRKNLNPISVEEFERTYPEVVGAMRKAVREELEIALHEINWIMVHAFTSLLLSGAFIFAFHAIYDKKVR